MLSFARLCEMTNAFNINITEELFNQFNTYAEFLVEYNKKINLTAITKAEDIEIKHFLDCLLLAQQREVCGKVADVGSGAGFPGFVLKLFEPNIALTVFEPTAKRGEFLKQLSEKLQLSVKITKERAEEAARKQWRQNFDFVTARAVAQLPVLAEYCLPLVKKGGYFVAMKGANLDEIDAAKPAIGKLGGKWRENRQYFLPDKSERCLVIIEKVTDTEEKYPRCGGVIVKRPL